jgi:AraC family transcriptional regulator
MRVAAYALGSIKEPWRSVQHDQIICRLLRPGCLEAGLRRSEIRKFVCRAGEMILAPRHLEQWSRTDDLHLLLVVSISHASPTTAACDGASGEVELRKEPKLVDARVSALMAAIDAERIAGFPNGPLLLDSVEQALAAALVERHALRRRPRPTYRGGLAPARLRRVVELVRAKIEHPVTLDELAESAGLSPAHFSQMFRRSTGESPHQFVLRHRVERAKEMLRRAEGRVLDVAVACGFKTQQHFARVFRRACGASPTEYRQEFSA